MTTPARALAVVASFVTTFVVGSAAAFADAPSSSYWSVDEGRSTLDTILLYGGGTVGLFLVCAVIGLLTARNNYVPPPASTEVERAGSHH